MITDRSSLLTSNMSNFTTLYPALLFPAIPLMMISFGNRYTSLASLIRKIHDLIVLNKHSKKTAGHYFDQILILTKRLNLVRSVQTLSGLSFLCNLFSIFASYLELSLIHISEPTNLSTSRMPSSA